MKQCEIHEVPASRLLPIQLDTVSPLQVLPWDYVATTNDDDGFNTGLIIKASICSASAGSALLTSFHNSFNIRVDRTKINKPYQITSVLVHQTTLHFHFIHQQGILPSALGNFVKSHSFFDLCDDWSLNSIFDCHP